MSSHIPYRLAARRRSISLAVARSALDGSLREVTPPASQTYRGTVREMPGSIVGGTLRNGMLRAAVALGDGRLFYVQPARDIDPESDPALHAVYDAAGAIGAEGTCAAHEPQQAMAPRPGDAGSEAVAAVRTADLAIDADFEFFTLNGSSVSATVADIENVMSAVNVVYQRDCELTHRLTTVIVRSVEPDPYTSTDADLLLDEFENHWNVSQTGVTRDVAHLMTGREVDGGTIGIAAVGVICSRTRAYGLSQSRFSSNLSRRCALTAHELGHNWNAVHCDGTTPCNIMCSSINGCNGIGLPNFEPRGITDIRAFAVSRSCLDSPPLAVDEPVMTGAVRLATPNLSPFASETRLSYFLERETPIRLDVYDVSGHRVASLAEGAKAAGWHTQVWNGRDRLGRRMEPGVFYARLEAAGETRSTKLVLVR